MLITLQSINFNPNKPNINGVIFDEQQYIEKLESAISKGLYVTEHGTTSRVVPNEKIIGQVMYYEYDKATKELLITVEFVNDPKLESDLPFPPIFAAMLTLVTNAEGGNMKADIHSFMSMYLNHYTGEQ